VLELVLVGLLLELEVFDVELVLVLVLEEEIEELVDLLVELEEVDVVLVDDEVLVVFVLEVLDFVLEEVVVDEDEVVAGLVADPVSKTSTEPPVLQKVTKES
jgi:hypothetical protein